MKALLAVSTSEAATTKASLRQPIVQHRDARRLIDAAAAAPRILAPTHLAAGQAVYIRYIIVKTSKSLIAIR